MSVVRLKENKDLRAHLGKEHIYGNTNASEIFLGMSRDVASGMHYLSGLMVRYYYNKLE